MRMGNPANTYHSGAGLEQLELHGLVPIVDGVMERRLVALVRHIDCVSE